MIKYTHVCDKCKSEEQINTSHNPSGWRTIELKYDLFRHNTVRYTLCVSCLQALGIAEPAPKTDTYEESKSKADELLELIAEIVSDRIHG